jgi:hypothetical protein
MKMKLVITGALAGLFSCAALADPEADFWQQPKSFIYSTRDSRGETVRFIVQGASGTARSFACRFDGLPSASDVDPSKIAPAGFPVHDVYIFVTPDSRNGGG